MTPLPPFPAGTLHMIGIRGSLTIILAAIFSVAGTNTACAQYRIGLSFGGASTVALVVEHRWDQQGLEVQAGTWRFRDLSLSVTGRQYMGSYAVEPFVGAGLWAIFARTEKGAGYGLIARLPTGFGWDFASRHSVALTIYLNRALALKRPDPEDRRPPRKTLIPLPELSYRWQSGS